MTTKNNGNKELEQTQPGVIPPAPPPPPLPQANSGGLKRLLAAPATQKKPSVKNDTAVSRDDLLKELQSGVRLRPTVQQAPLSEKPSAPHGDYRAELAARFKKGVKLNNAAERVLNTKKENLSPQELHLQALKQGVKLRPTSERKSPTTPVAQTVKEISLARPVPQPTNKASPISETNKAQSVARKPTMNPVVHEANDPLSALAFLKRFNLPPKAKESIRIIENDYLQRDKKINVLPPANASEKNLKEFLFDLRAELKKRTIDQEAILDFFDKLRDAKGGFAKIHSPMSLYERFMCFFSFNKGVDNNHFTHTNTYQKAVKMLKAAYIKKMDPCAPEDARAQQLIDYVRGNSPVHYSKTSTRVEVEKIRAINRQ